MDLDEDKLVTAKALGASKGFNSSDPDCLDQIKALTNGGVDCAIEMAGSEKALELAYQITRRGGLTVTGGLTHPDRKISIQQVSLFRQGRLPVDRLLSDTLTLETNLESSHGTI